MKRLGFGCMRLPMVGGPEGEVDQRAFQTMVDRFLAEGFTYFDTAHGYLGGKSETALRTALVERYPRSAYQLTDKLTASFIEREEDIRPFFEMQLERTGVDYFDTYLIHAVTVEHDRKFRACNAYEVARQLREEGKIRRLGLSFHDSPAFLEQVLTEHPELEVVQIQLNYADWDNPRVESGGVYEMCRRFHKPILVMEPVKGGALADLPPEGAAILAKLQGGSSASYALRYAASFPGVEMVLSGMSTPEQMEDNLAVMGDFQPLTEEERAAIEQVRTVLKTQDAIPCTGCRYCVDGCPAHIPIPQIFACCNEQKRRENWDGRAYYTRCTVEGGKASDCLNCGACEAACPQRLEVRSLLAQAAQTFETEQHA